MGAPEVVGFLTYLANERNCAPSTHKQALCAIFFLYKEVFKQALPWMTEIGRPKSVDRLRVVLTREEVQALFTGFDGVYALLEKLLFGTGMRIMEAMQWRIKDIEISQNTVIVRQGKSGEFAAHCVVPA